MKNATVLMDNENRHSYFLNDLGFSLENKWLCMMPTHPPHQYFKFDKFGLHTKDAKLTNYLARRDGIIIMLNYADLSESTFETIKTTIDKFPSKLIMIVIENGPSYKIPKSNEVQLEKFKNERKFNSQNVKLFLDDSFAYGAGDEAKKWFNSEIASINWQSQKSNNDNNLTSLTIDINEMVKMFEDCTMPLSLWDHYGRLRIVHYSLVKYGFDKTIDQDEWLCSNWKKFKTSIGHGKLWHYTLTRFWANLLYNLQNKYGYKTFDELYKNHPKIQQGSLFKEYYSDDVLFTDLARSQWIKPNLK